MPLPDITHDDTWTYETNVMGGPSGDQTAPVDVMVAVERVEMAGASTDAYRVTWTYGGSRAGESTTVWYRMTDFAKLQVRNTAPGSETLFTLEEPCAEWRFPLTVGVSWSTDCSFTGGGSTFSIPSQWEVVREEAVTVPAGTFDALVLEQRGDGFTETWWFARETCLYLQHESRGAAGGLTASEALLTFSCTPAPEDPTVSTPATTSPATTSPAVTSPAATSPAVTSPAMTTAGGTPPGATPTLTSPGGMPPTTTAAGTPAGEDAGSDTPGAPLVALLAAIGAAALVLRRKAS